MTPAVHLASDYASTPSGYVISIVLLIAIPAGGFIIKRAFGRVDSMSASIASLVQSLAVLVSETTADRAGSGQIRKDVETLRFDHTDLARSVAVLKEKIEEHVRAAAEDKREIQDQIRRRADS